MAIDSKMILQSFRQNGRSYQPGQEDELAQIITPDNYKDWAARGLIDGDWGVRNEGARENDAVNSEALEVIAAQISGGLGIDRSREETPLQFLQRYAQSVMEVHDHETHGLNPKYLKSLADAGIDPADTVHKTDKDLIDLKGIGVAAVREIRAAYGEYQEPLED